MEYVSYSLHAEMKQVELHSPNGFTTKFNFQIWLGMNAISLCPWDLLEFNDIQRKGLKNMENLTLHYNEPLQFINKWKCRRRP